jgi:glycosyltransferase involved in cell wall biosynthesis
VSDRLLHLTTSDVSLELLLGPQLRAFQRAGYEVHTASAPGPHVATLVADGIVHHPLRHATRSFAPHHDVAALGELWRLFRRVDPVIVHTHNPKTGVYGRIAARAARVPLVVNTQHGLYAQPGDGLGRRVLVYGLERVAAAFSDVELVQNPEDLDVLARLGVRRSKLWFLGNGVDLTRFRPQPELRASVRIELGIGPDEVAIGAVGRLVWEKGYFELFEAARALMTANPKVRVVVAGPFDDSKGDPLSAADVAEAERSGVTFLGMRDDVERLYQAFDLYVLASHREGWPRSAMEAAACGLPIVATDVRGCRQVVLDEVTGLLVPVRTAETLAEALERLVLDEGLRARLGAAGRVLAEERFSDRRVIETCLEAYRTVGRSPTTP